MIFTGSLFAQGRGRGGDHRGGGNRGGGHHERGGGGDRGGGNHERRGGGDRGRGQRERHQQEQQQIGGGWQQHRPQMQERRQQVDSRRNAQHQQMRVERQQNRRPQFEQWRNHQRAQQIHAQRNQRQRQGENWQRVERQPRDLERRRWNTERQGSQHRKIERREHRQFTRRGWQNEGRAQFFEKRRDNWGHFRRQEAFAAKRQRNALRAGREYWRSDRKDDRYNNDRYRDNTRYRVYSNRYVNTNNWFGDDYSDYDRYSRYTVYTPEYRSIDYVYDDAALYSPYAYNDDYYYENSEDGLDWKSLLFRSVIGAFFSNGDNAGYLDPSPEYASGYDDGSNGYIPEYTSQAPYYTFGNAPAYSYYEPAAYYGYQQFRYGQVPYDHVAYSSLPYNDMVDIYSGGVAGELIQRALVTGYQQGLLEGEQARERGWGDDHYNDPYLYEQALYDPYSSSMGNCRRYMSEGYEMGYRDALAGRGDYALEESGDIDLVSMLIGSTLSLRG